MIEQLNSSTFQSLLPCGDRVEIGDVASLDFKPHLKLNRWGDECSIKVGIPTTEKQDAVLDGGKVKWSGKDMETNFYALEPRVIYARSKDKDVVLHQCEMGGFEFEFVLKKKPANNWIALDMETRGLKFYYQPPLTQEEIDEGAVRPDNVVGSYVAYHDTKGSLHRNQADADKYKSGIAFHIYRPKATDANGDWIWGELSISSQTLTVTLDATWLNKARYPVVVDPDFGYTTLGGSVYGINDDHYAIGYYSPAGDGTLQTMSMAASGYTAGEYAICGLYTDDGGHDGYSWAFVTGSTTDQVQGDNRNNWYTFPYSGTPPDVYAATQYYLCVLSASYITVYYNTGSSGDSWYLNDQGTWPNFLASPARMYGSTRLIACYATYGAAAAGWTGKINGVTNPAKINGIAVANIAKVNGVA